MQILARAGAKCRKYFVGKDLGRQNKQKNMDHTLDMGSKFGYNTHMENNTELLSEACSQFMATVMVEHYPHLAAMGLTGFEIYEALSEGEIQ